MKMTVPLFIFTATICCFIKEKFEVLEHQLKIVLENLAMTSSSQMERIYLPILKHSVKMLRTQPQGEGYGYGSVIEQERVDRSILRYNVCCRL